MLIKIILYILIFISIIFGLYKMFIDDEKGVAYASFIFAILVFFATLIPNNAESKQTIIGDGNNDNKQEEGIEKEELKENIDQEESKESVDEDEIEAELEENINEIGNDNKVVNQAIQKSEVESNDTVELSNLTEVNKQYQGKISSEEDVDYYKFKIEGDGKVSITFQHPKIDSGDVFWEISLMDSKKDDEIIYFASIGGNTNEESPTARIVAGEYYIKINSYYYSDKDYIFIANFVEESDTYEKEENDQIDVANNISINTKYIGNLQTNEDIDYFKFTAECKGKVNISFEHEKIDSEDVLWEVSLLDGVNDDIVISLFCKGREASLQSDFARIPPGDYYLKVNSYYYSNKDYSFAINFEGESEEYESEINNEFGSANSIFIGQRYIGNIQTNEDIDYFCFTISEARNIAVIFEHAMVDSNDTYWEVCLIDEVGNENILQMSIAGTESSISGIAENLEPGVYYIKVIPYYYNNSDYTLLIE